jgi:hypothetical protein
VTVNSKEENSRDFCSNYVQEFGLWKVLNYQYLRDVGRDVMLWWDLFCICSTVELASLCTLQFYNKFVKTSDIFDGKHNAVRRRRLLYTSLIIFGTKWKKGLTLSFSSKLNAMIYSQQVMLTHSKAGKFILGQISLVAGENLNQLFLFAMSVKYKIETCQSTELLLNRAGPGLHGKISSCYSLGLRLWYLTR